VQQGHAFVFFLIITVVAYRIDRVVCAALLHICPAFSSQNRFPTRKLKMTSSFVIGSGGGLPSVFAGKMLTDSTLFFGDAAIRTDLLGDLLVHPVMCVIRPFESPRLPSRTTVPE
jgi:hypothetical protein